MEKENNQMHDGIHRDLKTKIENFFEDNAQDFGTIDRPTKNGLIALALKGKDIWNAWASNADCQIDFSNYHFGPGFDFSGFLFSSKQGGVSFKGCKFANARFTNSTFNGDAYFSEAEISHASFIDCVFAGATKFTECTFIGPADFHGSKFSGEFSFYKSFFNQESNFSSSEFHQKFTGDDTKFNGHSNFNKCKFFSEVSFSRAGPISVDFSESIFLKKFVFAKNKIWSAKFSSALFYEECFFNESVFHGESFFRDCEFRKHASYRGCTFSDHIDFDRTRFHSTLDFSCNLQESEPKESLKVWNISFRGCDFAGVANFDNRNFSYRCDFGPIKQSDSGIHLPTRFHKAPTFHGCTFHQDTTFHGSYFVQNYGDDAARAYRTLKLASEKLKATRDEQKFFHLEVKAERPSLSRSRQLLSYLYEWSSDYGFSLRRPLLALFALSLLIGAGHGLLANACATRIDCVQTLEGDYRASSGERTSDLIKYSLANVAPVPGLDRMQSELRGPLFGERGPIAIAAIALEIFHKLTTLVMTFLFALGVRNLFKMKS